MQAIAGKKQPTQKFNWLKVRCQELENIRGTKGGNKAYHTMIAAYFTDMAFVFRALRRVASSNCKICFVVGDSAPYGVYVPVEQWLGKLAIAAGFDFWSFEQIRQRNVKWKNRKHNVPLQEGRLWIEGECMAQSPLGGGLSNSHR